MSALPKGWTRRRLRFDLDTNPKKSQASLDPSSEVSFVPMDAVGEFGDLDGSLTKEVSEVYDGYTYFADGDVCIAKITPCFENGKGALAEGLINGIGFGTTELHVLRPRDTLDAKFLFYVTIAHDFRRIGASEMLGAGGQKRVPERFVKDWRPPLPPLETQRRIARLLDAKTTQIDALIAKKRALLERLAEKRQALITQAVTKGLDPHAPMKDSGIDWLGQIPAHWEVVPIRWYLRTGSGDGIRSTEIESDRGTEAPVPVIGGNGCMGFTACANSGNASLVVGRVGALCGNVHPVVEPSWVTDNALKLYGLRNFEPLYLLHVLRVRDLNGLASRNAQPLMTGEIVRAQRIPMPSPSEQAKIAEFLSRQLSSMDARDSLIQGSVRLLQEYRSALITAAITGQLEIPADGQHDRADECLGKLATEVA